VSSTAQRRVACLAGELGDPRAELLEAEPNELGGVRRQVPQRERALEVPESLQQSKDGLCLARRFDRGDERLVRATRRRPVRGELGGCRGFAPRQLLGNPRVQFLALTGQNRRVDRLRKECVPEAEDPCPRLGYENVARNRLAQQVAHLRLGQRRRCAKQRVFDVAAGSSRHAQQALRRTVEPGTCPTSKASWYDGVGHARTWRMPSASAASWPN
jgi:hypothetical protein